MSLGRSQKAAFDLLKMDGPSTTQFVGDQLYEKTSSCYTPGGGYGMGGRASPSQIRKQWASKILNELAKKGLVGHRAEKKEKIWFVIEG